MEINMKKLLFFFLFLCVANLDAQTPKQITFTEADCIPAGSSTLTWQAINKKLNDVFIDANISDNLPSHRRIDNIQTFFSVSITGTITNIGAYAFIFCDKLVSIDVSSATTIGFQAFAECSALENINMPSAVTIGEIAFYGCDKLISIDIPLVKIIEKGVFLNCRSLESADMPKVTAIGERAFYNCNSLQSITILTSTPPTLEEDVFGEVDILDSRVPDSCTLRVANPKAVNKYKKDKSWKSQFLPRKILPVSP